MATIKALKTKLEDGTEQVVFPKTLPEAVIDSKTGKTLDVVLDEISDTINNIEITGGGGTTYELSRADDTITLTGGDGSSSDVNVSDKMSKSGGIFTGNVEFEGGVSRIDITGQTINIDDLTLFDGSCHIMKYINKTNAGSTNISNVPVGSTPFTLDVELIRWASTTDYISKQVFICSSGKHQFRVRYCTSGTWGDWSTYDFNDIVSKSGDTMNGTLNANAGLNVSSPNYPPMTVTRSGVPYSSAIRFANSNGTLGAIGMTATGDELLRWSPDEQTISTVLDSGNYSNYTVPKTGGTFSGGVTFDSGVNVKGGFTSSSESTIFPQDYYCFQCNDGAGKEGYWKLCTINVTGTYADAPILFYMTSRGHAGKVAIRFNAGSDVSATSLYSLSRESGINSCYVIKTSGTSSGSVFDVYVKKEVPWGNLTVNHLEFPKYMRDLVTLTWSGAYVASLPSGTTEATAYTILNTTNYSSNIPAATQSAVGLMSAADKKKLDGIASGANAYSLPTASSSTLGGVKTTSKVTSTSGLTACPIISGVPYYKDTNTTYTIDTSLSSTSTNPVQNKVVHSHMSARLQLAGGTMTGDIKFNNDKGIKDINGNWMLVKSSSVAATLGSIKNKYPTYVGHTSSTSETTYVRGQFLALYGAKCINANASIGVASDKRVKTNESLLIDEIDKYNQFFDNLQPRKYNYIRDEEGKAKSIGFFAQEVHQALLDAGLTLEDFGGINIQESFLEGQAEGDDEAVWYQDFYSLAYDEFIPIIVSKIQYLEKMYNARLEEIENDYNAKLSSLEERISKLEEAKA